MAGQRPSDGEARNTYNNNFYGDEENDDEFHRMGRRLGLESTRKRFLMLHTPTSVRSCLNTDWTSAA